MESNSYVVHPGLASTRLTSHQIIIIVGTLGTAIAGGSLGISVYGVIIFWRFIMGVGIGGDYPVSSVITSEFAARKIRGRMMAAVFSAQGWGNRECTSSNGDIC
jgi:PHS family inorganic phosphate transporter-like MFS transporter